MRFDKLVRSRIKELEKEITKADVAIRANEGSSAYWCHKKRKHDLEQALNHNKKILMQITGVH